MAGEGGAWVYLLRCADGTLYCGWTSDLDRRLAAHEAGTASKYTRPRRPVRLAASFDLAGDRTAARSLEARTKLLDRPAKERLVARGRPWVLLGPDGPYASPEPGTLGGHRRTKVFGRLDCPGALRALARGGPYARHRVFFAGERAARAAGFRPCARCLPEAYAVWKAAQPGP